MPDVTDGDITDQSDINSHPAFGGIIAAIELSSEDWQHLLDKGFVTVRHHRDSNDGDSVIELTIKAPVPR
jgi:hypothetical protein